MRQGDVDFVFGRRMKRKDGFVKSVSTKIANSVRNWLTGENIVDTGCPLKIMRRDVVDRIPLYKGMHRFFITLAHIEGFRTAEVPVASFAMSITTPIPPKLPVSVALSSRAPTGSNSTLCGSSVASMPLIAVYSRSANDAPAGRAAWIARSTSVSRVRICGRTRRCPRRRAGRKPARR